MLHRSCRSCFVDATFLFSNDLTPDRAREHMLSALLKHLPSLRVRHNYSFDALWLRMDQQFQEKVGRNALEVSSGEVLQGSKCCITVFQGIKAIAARCMDSYACQVISTAHDPNSLYSCQSLLLMLLRTAQCWWCTACVSAYNSALNLACKLFSAHLRSLQAYCLLLLLSDTRCSTGVGPKGVQRQAVTVGLAGSSGRKAETDKS